ncbi:MAG: isoamylase early set domain-containing protein [Desulfosalsimonas sp.]|uniref:isoamylase early set domain-containing protein n=1 Tax=Desulfosalsimonas sp. TaxID=3073848 RepID=UPI00397049F7
MGNSNKGKRRISFRVAAPDALSLSLAGDFNNWDTDKHPLKKMPGGFWEKNVMLPPGRYEYKYMIDGRWCLDPANHKSCENCFGGRNSVIEVASAPAAVRLRKP